MSSHCTFLNRKFVKNNKCGVDEERQLQSPLRDTNKSGVLCRGFLFPSPVTNAHNVIVCNLIL